MVVVFEFLGDEPIENVITCMHYKVDKVIYFGYHDVLLKQKEPTTNFLKKYCGVSKTVFCEVSSINIQSTIKTIKTEIEREISLNNDIFFDLTGGECLVLVAFGMLSKEYDTPMHMYNIEENTLIELDVDSKKSIDKIVPPRVLNLDLDKYIELHGGIINNTLHKSTKNMDDISYALDIDKIWNVASNHSSLWNPFSDFLKQYMIPDENLYVCENASTIISKLRASNTYLNNAQKLNTILDELASVGVLNDLVHYNGKYEFSFKNRQLKDLIWEGGSILELHMYQQERTNSDDCKIGVHLDWDGVIQNETSDDVINEIDILALKGNIPIFISCKSGKMGKQQTLHALYELQTVTNRFGGKYAKMILATTQPISRTNMLRAQEMRIEVKSEIV